MQQIDTMGARTARTRLTERSMRRIVAWMAVVLLVGTLLTVVERMAIAIRRLP